MGLGKPLVFVSCGQYTENERRLGRHICSLLAHLRPEVTPYFADQSTVEGLSSQVLKALYRAAGFICVMHRRGDFSTPDGRSLTRGSVWIEQEIAIAAFMNHVLDRSIPILFYKQEGVSLEGIRSVLLMNPRVEFTEEKPVLEHLKSSLPSTAFVPFNSYDLAPVITHKFLRGESNGDHHNYKLIADVENVGVEHVLDFALRVYFPRAFLVPIMWAAEDRTRSTTSHVCFTAGADGRAPDGLYSGDRLRNPLTIEYFVDHDLHDDPRAMSSEIKVELMSGSMRRKTATLPIKDFQEF